MKWPVFVTVLSDSVPSSCTLLSSLESPLDRFSVCRSVNRIAYPARRNAVKKGETALCISPMTRFCLRIRHP